MSDSCNINDSKPEFTGNPVDVLQFKEGKNIKITEELTDANRIITIGYEEYRPPTIEYTSSVGVTKVGVTITTVTFTGLIKEGTETILETSTTPDKGLDLSAQFQWTESNVLGTSPGLWPQFNGNPLEIYAKDSEGTEVTEYAGVEYRHLFYMGYSTKESLVEADVATLINLEDDLLTSVKSKYSTYRYNYTVVPVYIYWLFPADSPSFTEATEGPLPVPLKLDLGNISITESGITKSYRVIRTAAKTSLDSAKITLL